MKKLAMVLMLAASIAFVGNANAAIVLTPEDNVIDLTGYIEAVSTYAEGIAPGSSFVDAGTIDRFSGVYPVQYPELEASWTNLTGTMNMTSATDMVFDYATGTATMTVAGVPVAVLTLVDGSGSYSLLSQTGAVDLVFAAELLADGEGQFEDGEGVAYTAETFDDLQFAINFDTNQAVIGPDTITLSSTTADIRTSNVVPEPTSMALFGLGLVGAAVRRRFA